MEAKKEGLSDHANAVAAIIALTLVAVALFMGTYSEKSRRIRRAKPKLACIKEEIFHEAADEKEASGTLLSDWKETALSSSPQHIDRLKNDDNTTCSKVDTRPHQVDISTPLAKPATETPMTMMSPPPISVKMLRVSTSVASSWASTPTSAPSMSVNTLQMSQSTAVQSKQTSPTPSFLSSKTPRVSPVVGHNAQTATPPIPAKKIRATPSAAQCNASTPVSTSVPLLPVRTLRASKVLQPTPAPFVPAKTLRVATVAAQLRTLPLKPTPIPPTPTETFYSSEITAPKTAPTLTSPPPIPAKTTRAIIADVKFSASPLTSTPRPTVFDTKPRVSQVAPFTASTSTLVPPLPAKMRRATMAAQLYTSPTTPTSLTTTLIPTPPVPVKTFLDTKTEPLITTHSLPLVPTTGITSIPAINMRVFQGTVPFTTTSMLSVPAKTLPTTMVAPQLSISTSAPTQIPTVSDPVKTLPSTTVIPQHTTQPLVPTALSPIPTKKLRASQEKMALTTPKKLAPPIPTKPQRATTVIAQSNTPSTTPQIPSIPTKTLSLTMLFVPKPMPAPPIHVKPLPTKVVATHLSTPILSPSLTLVPAKALRAMSPTAPASTLMPPPLPVKMLRADLRGTPMPIPPKPVKTQLETQAATQLDVPTVRSTPPGSVNMSRMIARPSVPPLAPPLSGPNIMLQVNSVNTRPSPQI